MTGDQTYTVRAEDDGVRVDRWFKRNRPDVSHALLSRWLRTGRVRVDADKASVGDRLTTGQVLLVPPLAPVTPPAGAGLAPRAPRKALMPDEVEFALSLVLHKDDAAIVLNKPPGLATQGGPGITQHVDGLLDALRFGYADRPRLVHRLDKDTSGTLLIARTPNAASFFAKSFSSRSADKVYWALVVGTPERRSGAISLKLNKMPATGGEKMMVDEEHGQTAKTLYRVVERAGDRAAWLELRPLTGRTHQLRVHCLAIGCPIVGDGKYGGAAAHLTGGVSRKLHLHARSLTVPHPAGGVLEVLAPLPEHMAATWDMFGLDATARPAPPPAPKYEVSVDKPNRRGERRARGVAGEPRLPRGR